MKRFKHWIMSDEIRALRLRRKHLYKIRATALTNKQALGNIENTQARIDEHENIISSILDIE